MKRVLEMKDSKMVKVKRDPERNKKKMWLKLEKRTAKERCNERGPRV
jgi:hypothetical protein